MEQQNPGGKKINFKKTGPFMRNGIRTLWATTAASLFAVKTTAVISPNTGKGAIIIEHQHALRVHTHAQRHTCTKAQTHTA